MKVGNIFKKFSGKKIKYRLMVYDGVMYREYASGSAKNEDEILQDLAVMKEKGIINENIKFRVVDDKGKIIFENNPSNISKSSNDDYTDEYRIEYRTNPTGRWRIYDKMSEEPDIDLVESLANSDKLPPGSEIRIVHVIGKRKEVIYRTKVNFPEGHGVVSSEGGKLMIDIEEIKKLKKTINALREIRDEIDEVIGGGKSTGYSVNPNDYEGKPPWFFRPDVLGPIIGQLLGGGFANSMGNANNKSKGNNIDELDEYLD